jgi:hypothetical protein
MMMEIEKLNLIAAGRSKALKHFFLVVFKLEWPPGNSVHLLQNVDIVITRLKEFFA